MPYVVQIVPSARNALDELPRNAQERIVLALALLRDTPRPPHAKTLVGADDRWRIRVGDYRVIYQVADRELLVLVVCIGHRRDVYRDR